ncbi:MAG TPA: hypothetical protein VGR91_08060 [Stellaceae bacterium]|nr:hypothetical protein [Stellaceae bacterium]
MSARWTERSILRRVAAAAEGWHAQPKSAERRAELGRWLGVLACWDEAHGAEPEPALPLDRKPGAAE